MGEGAEIWMFPPLFSMPKVPVQFVVDLFSVVLSLVVLAIIFTYVHGVSIPWLLLGFVFNRYVSELWKRTKLEEGSQRL